MIGVIVLSADEEPIILEEILITNLERDRIVEICDEDLGNCVNAAHAGYPEEGLYYIFHDGLRDEIVGKKSKIRMQGSNEKISFYEEFQIGDNGCHVFKAAGPDTVFVETD